MTYQTCVRSAAFAVACFLIGVAGASADVYTKIVKFGDDGQPVSAMTAGADGKLYGTALNGGTYGYGSVFSIDPSSATPSITTLHSFNGTGDGAHPRSKLVLANDGNFYGTTSESGPLTAGTVFRITPLGILTTLASFSPTTGGGASSLIQGTDGNLYGTTIYGGASSWGTVFKMTTAGTLTTLVSFTLQTGAQPRSGLVEGPDGNFYGTTSFAGGSSGGGAIFRVTPTGTLTIVHVFELNPNPHGFQPTDLLLSSDGNFYGTTKYGTGFPLGGGTLFRLTLTPAVQVTTLYSFPATWVPDSGAIEGSDGVLYGTATTGGTGLGSAYAVTRSGTLVSQTFFDGTNGSLPAGGLVQTADGKLYGVTSRGNPNSVSNEGTIFRFDPPGTPAITTLARFGARAGGYAPTSLLRGFDGALYGLTGNYAGTGYGSIVKVTLASPTVLSTMTTLATLGAADGTDPSRLIQAADGSLYGTTAHGGPQGGGTIFRVTLAGVVSTVVAFTDLDSVTGSSPRGGVIQGADGNLYGTTYEGGANGAGTLFKVALDSPTPALTTLLPFGGTNGTHPLGPLAQAPNGALYGTTEAGGLNGFGTVFVASTSGVLTRVVPFTGINGAQPATGVIHASDGNAYGTTPSGSTFGCGTIFRLSPDGVLTVLFAFTCTYGEHPASALTEGAAGQFYGTTDGVDVNARLLYGITSTGFMMGIIRGPEGLDTAGLGAILATTSTDVYGIVQGGELGGGMIYHLTTIAPVAYNLGSAAAPWVVLRRVGTTGQLQSSVTAGSARQYQIVSPPAKGSVQLSVAGDGNFTYTSNGNATGADQFTFTVSTAFGTSNVATVFVSVVQEQPLRDFDGDGRADMTLHKSNGNWAILKSSGGYTSSTVVNWGTAGIAVPGDYDGDRKADPAVYQQATGEWLALTSSSGYASLFHRNWGGPGYVPAAGDYDGDGKIDLAVVRRATGQWYVLLSGAGYTTSMSVAAGAGTPVPGLDFDGDEKADVAVYRRATGTWSIFKSSTGFATAVDIVLGGRGITLVAGDYDGDGKADPAVYERATGRWLARKSASGTMLDVTSGGPGFDPVPGDYDGDGAFDLAIVERATGHWTARLSTTSFTTTLSVTGWGAATDTIVTNAIPVPIVVSDTTRATDADGDERADMTFYDTTSGEWRTLTSTTGFTAPLIANWGGLGFTAVPGDYDGDGKADRALYQGTTGEWYVLLSGANFTTMLHASAGGPGYVPVAADYDGDGRTDPAVYNTATGLWYVLKSGAGYSMTLAVNWGGADFTPAPADFDGDGRADLAVYSSSTGDWYVLLSIADFTTAMHQSVGGTGYSAVPGDYDGDGRADFVVYNTSTGVWYGLLSSGAFTTTINVGCGGTGYAPVAGDYDGDGRVDLAVYHASSGTWYIRLSGANYTTTISRTWG